MFVNHCNHTPMYMVIFRFFLYEVPVTAPIPVTQGLGGGLRRTAQTQSRYQRTLSMIELNIIPRQKIQLIIHEWRRYCDSFLE